MYDGAQRRFHLFFMRQDASNSAAIHSGKKIVHVWTDNLLNWSSQDSSFSVGTGWDGLSLWAPYVFQVGNLYYMYYTGVDATGLNQRIGYATTTDLNVPGSSWTRNTSAVFTASQTNWAAAPSTQQQMRDPFVIPDPADNTRFLLFYSAVDRDSTTWGAVGVAQSTGSTPTSWVDQGLIAYTRFDKSFTKRVESPMTFMHINTAHTPPDTSWYLMFTDWWSPGSISFDVNAHTPADRSTIFGPNNWVRVNKKLVEWAGDAVVGDWSNSEYVRWSSHEYMGGYYGQEIRFVQFKWRAGAAGVPDSLFLQSATDVADRPKIAESVALRLVSRNGGPRVEWEIDLPGQMPARLELFDVSGRRVRMLTDGVLPAGVTRVHWDGQGGSGEHVGSGVYFARLRYSTGEMTARAVFVR
jgi:hypothetical protein